MTEQRSIGQSDVRIAPLGVGTWAWGDWGYWSYGSTHQRDDLNEAFLASVNAGITLFDTAEVYSMGESERILGDLIRKSRTSVVVATKYAPFPWRVSPITVRIALEASIDRLGIEQVDLYQVHWPPVLLSQRALMTALAELVHDGRIRAVGVSNYSAGQVLEAYDALERHGVLLAANQIHYNLLHRKPEINNVLTVCRDRGMTILAYSPLAQGLLTGKYTASNRPGGIRRLASALEDMDAVQQLIGLLREIGQGHGDKTPAQVALNWLVAQENVIPIPGAKNAQQAASNAQAIGWSLTPDEQQTISTATLKWRR